MNTVVLCLLSVSPVGRFEHNTYLLPSPECMPRPDPDSL